MQNLKQIVRHSDHGNLSSVNGVSGLLSPYGGFGQQGNILPQSDDLTASWTAEPGAAVTANTTDVLDPVGTHTASKLVTGAISGNMALYIDLATPDPGSVVRAGGSTATNASRSFILSLYVYSPVENQMDVQLASVVSGTLDANNTFWRRLNPFRQDPETNQIGWSRVDYIVQFTPGASTGTVIRVALAVGTTSTVIPLVGFSSTFYFWRVTLQEVSQHRPLTTRATGVAVPYAVGFFSSTDDAIIAYQPG